MIACVSELALYQATSKKLQVDCDMCAEALAVARHRLESGEAPTDDAEREWRRQLRVVEMRDIVASVKAEEQRINALMFEPSALYVYRGCLSDALRRAAETHAEIRPTAYIPGAWAQCGIRDSVNARLVFAAIAEQEIPCHLQLNSDDNIGLPKPYSFAPFKPSEVFVTRMLPSSSFVHSLCRQAAACVMWSSHSRGRFRSRNKKTLPIPNMCISTCLSNSGNS
jgi:hypothetical protein